MDADEPVELKPTSPRDFPVLRRLFDDPSFAGWGDTSGRMADADIRAKYLGGRLPEVECFLVTRGSSPVGLTQLHADSARTGGIDLILLSSSRGRGVGRAAVNALVERARTVHEWEYVTVDPDLSNTDGTTFWQAVGFDPVRRLPGTQRRAPYLLMQRRLD